MTGRGHNEPKSMMVHESISVPMNHRDASNTSTSVWRNPPTPIPVPAADGRPQRPSRPQDNPYSRMTNTLGFHGRRPGNPNVGQTVLAKARVGSSVSMDSHVRKRQKLDHGIGPTITSNGVSSSYTRAPVPSTGVSEPDIQVIEPPQRTNYCNNPVPNDAEIIDLGTSSSDPGERVPRAKSSSPDPILLTGGGNHPFDTRPTEYNSFGKRKGVSTPYPWFVDDSEEEEIEEFTPPPPLEPPSNAKKSREIPERIVQERRKVFEGAPSPAPAAIRRPVENVKSIDLTTQTVVGRMKKRDEGAIDYQRSMVVPDVGTSSSNFVNSAREKEKVQKLPLKAWCFGHHSFQHSESTPLKLTYEVALQRMRVTWGRSPPEKISEFKLDRDVSSVMVVNDSEEPLREDVVVQFNTIPGATWREAERKYKGFTGGGERGKGALTFLFSITKDQGLTATIYQEFIVSIRKKFQSSSVEIIKPSKGQIVWDYAFRRAAMFEQTQSRNAKKDRNENVPDDPSTLTRSVTPCSSTSVRIGPEPKSKSSSGDPGPSTSLRRSTRTPAIRSSRASPPLPPPAQSEPDEVILLYPPTGTGALSITYSDLRRLQPEEYLNDTLIEFGLKLWLNDLRTKDPALADQIHVFSSFFYKKLNNKKSPGDGYQSVRKWTSRTDIFTKKYIIVPINENIHWYLAIIYEPGHTLEPPLPPSQNSNARTPRKRKHAQDRGTANSETLTEVSLEQQTPAVHPNEGELEVETSSVDATRAVTPSMTEYEEIDDAFDRSCSITAAGPTSDIQNRDSSPNLVHPPSDNMDIDADVPVMGNTLDSTCGVPEVLEPSASRVSSSVPVSQFYGPTRKSSKDVEADVFMDNGDSGEDQQQEAEVDDMLAVTQSPSRELPSQSYIFTLDSLGTRHPQAIKVLKRYLASEAKDKRNFDEVREAVGKQVQVPVQPNTWDCGIYLLHFVKVFMSSPAEFVEQILSTRGTMPSSERKKMWQDHEIPQSRDHLKSRITQLSDEWKAEKSVQDEGASKRASKNAPEVEALSSEGEVDIVEDIPRIKAIPGPKQRQPAMRLRG